MKQFVSKFGKYVPVAVVALLGIATAQTTDTLVAASDVSATKSAWIGAAAVGVPGMLGILGVKLAADFIFARLKKAGR